MKKVALSIGLLLKISPALSAQLPVSNVGVLSLARTLDADSRVVLEVDTDDLDPIQTFEIDEVSVVLSNGELVKSPLFLNDKRVQVKIKDEFLTVASLGTNKNIDLHRSIFAESVIEKDHFVLKLRLPAEEKTK